MAFTIAAKDVFYLKTLFLTEFPLQESLVMIFPVLCSCSYSWQFNSRGCRICRAYSLTLICSSVVVKLAQAEMVKYI